MVFISKLAGIAAVALLAGSAIAHPGEHHDPQVVKRQIKARNQMASASKRSIDNCSNSLKHRELMARSVARRAAVAAEIRQKRNIKTPARKYRRDLATLETFEAINHNQTGILDFTASTSAATIFSANTSCILSPEVTDGPYYVTGEQIRQDVTESELGVPLYLEVQYLDITTCLPVPAIYVDVWNCNATGVYAGTEAAGYETTFLRGIQATDDDGVAAFETIFPGHYDGRAIHTHLLSHTNVTVFANGTISGGAVNHIGQLFWNEELRSAVEELAPYNTNTQAITSNADDMWSIVQAENAYDPFPEYIQLGESLQDGLLAWIQIGINMTADYTSSDYYAVSASRTEDGVVVNEVAGGAGGGPGGNGTAPTGAPPS